MINPLIKNYKMRALCLGVWVLFTCIQTLIMYSYAEAPIGYVLIDALLYNSIFAVLVLLLWYPLYFNQQSDKSWSDLIFIQIFIACIFLLVWQSLGHVLVVICTDSDLAYHDFLVSSLPWRMIFGVLQYSIVFLFYYVLNYVDKLKEKAENEIRLNEIIRDSELNLLRSQINPHFLFNSLNSVNSLILQDVAKAREMVVALSDFLRYTVVSTNQNMMSVEQEIENVERYLSIEKLRFGEKLTYNFEVPPEVLPVKMPSMMLQPLFENAVKHGVCESLQAVHIWVRAELREERVFIEISNNFESGTSAKKGSGTGLKNIGERLRLLYGKAASLQAKKENEKFSVTLQFPI